MGDVKGPVISFKRFNLAVLNNEFWSKTRSFFGRLVISESSQ